MHTNKTILKVLRGDILIFIYDSAPARVKETSIISGYFEYYTTADIKRSISYLAQSGYIRKKEVESPISNRCEAFYEITPEGMKVVERIKGDDGVTIMEKAE